MLVPRVGTEPFTKVRNKIGKSGGDVIFCVGWQGCLCRGGMVWRDNTTKKEPRKRLLCADKGTPTQ